VGCGEDEGAESRVAEPVGEFAADGAAGVAAAATCYDFDAADVVGVGGLEEFFQGLVGGLDGFAVQVEGAFGAHAAAAKACPGGFVEAWGVNAGDEMGQRGGASLW